MSAPRLTAPGWESDRVGMTGRKGWVPDTWSDKTLQGARIQAYVEALKMGDAEERRWSIRKWVKLGRQRGKGQRMEVTAEGLRTTDQSCMRPGVILPRPHFTPGKIEALIAEEPGSHLQSKTSHVLRGGRNLTSTPTSAMHLPVTFLQSLGSHSVQQLVSAVLNFYGS